MSTSIPSPWVPASLVRVRCFLNARGMKVRPWLGPREVLVAFCAALKSQERDDAFWADLKGLLANLSRDMRVRAEARGWVGSQELFDADSYEELLAQIRGALKAQPPSGFGLPELARTIPPRAAALLIMLGSAVSVGCGGEVGDGAGAEQATGGATAVASGGAPSGGTAGSGGTGGVTQAETGGFQLIPIDAGSVATGGVGGGAADPAATPTCNGELAEVIGECDDLSESDKSSLIRCACLLNDAWETGLAAMFENGDCSQVIENYFSCCSYSGWEQSGVDVFCRKEPQSLPAEFEPELLIDNYCCPVYLGVRCD